MELSILVVSYNTCQLTLDCLRSVYEQTRLLKFEVIVLDNQSHDGSAEAIARRFPEVQLKALTRNIGFARGNNLAAEAATGEFLLLLNPDTVILDDAIQRVMRFAGEHPEAAIFGGRTIFADGKLNPNSCHGRPTPWSLLCMGLGLSSLFRRSRWLNPEGLGAWQRDTAREVDAVTGCFLLIRRTVWQELGGFDESFFMYGEDTDLCLRARKLGYKCMICPDATLVHHGGASEPVRADKMVRLFRAKGQLFKKHWRSGTMWFGMRMLDLWAMSRMGAFAVISRCQRSRAASYHAWRDVWRRRGEFHRA